MRASVEAPEPPEIAPGRNALTLLLPLLGAQHFYLASKANPEVTQPMLGHLATAADKILESEQGARGLSFAGRELVGVEIPSVVSEPQGKSPRVFTCGLRRGRGAGSFLPKSRAPLRGGQPFFAVCGHLLLIQDTASKADYSTTVVPAAVGLRLLVNLIEVAPSLAEMGPTVVNQLEEPITRFVLSEDPRQELADSERRYAEHQRAD